MVNVFVIVVIVIVVFQYGYMLQTTFSIASPIRKDKLTPEDSINELII